jgi:CubicO group peptidase (beta-lactamase class C family)
MPRRLRIAPVGGLALAGLALLGPLPRAAAQENYWPTHGWQRSSPEAQGMDSKVLAEAFDYIRQHQIPIHSLTIVRNGFIVLDAYFWPFQNRQLHDLASVTKSITATLVGIAIGQHKLRGVNQPLVPLFAQRSVANRDARKDRVTLEHLLTMTSGLNCVASHEVTLAEMMRSSDWVQFMLDRPMSDEPGSRYEYCSGGMHLLSAVLAQATGENTLDFARHELFGPLGIEEVGWPADPHGIPHGWGDLRLQPRDMAKIGYLWLHGGRWEGLQLVPADWMTAATQVHSHPGLTRGQEYGYGLWIYPRRTPPIFEGLGRGGQRISVVPAQNLVVVFTGGTFEPGDIGDFIGRSIKSGRPLPEDSAGTTRLAAAIAEAAKPPAAHAVPAPPPLAATVSGKRFVLDANPIGLASLSLTFPGGAEARVSLNLGGRVEQRPVGLDGVPRVSPDGRFGLPVAMSGAWEGGSTFVLTYDEVGNINAVRLRLTFSGSDVKVEMSERSGLLEEQLHGRANE